MPHVKTVNSAQWRHYTAVGPQLELPSLHCPEASNSEMVPVHLEYLCTPDRVPGFYHRTLACFSLPFLIHIII